MRKNGKVKKEKGEIKGDRSECRWGFKTSRKVRKVRKVLKTRETAL